jgi:hypothetical protein
VRAKGLIESAPYWPTTRKTVQMMVTRKPNQIASMTSRLSRSGVNQFPPRLTQAHIRSSREAEIRARTPRRRKSDAGACNAPGLGGRDSALRRLTATAKRWFFYRTRQGLAESESHSKLRDMTEREAKLEAALVAKAAIRVQGRAADRRLCCAGVGQRGRTYLITIATLSGFLACDEGLGHRSKLGLSL